MMQSVNGNEEAGILDMTEQMLVLAKAGEWETLFSVERLRAEKIGQAQFTEHDNLMIEKILQVDNEIRELAEKERAGLLSELKKLSQGKNAINAYAP